MATGEVAPAAAQVPTIYESMLYPMQVGGGGTDIPAEVSAIKGAGCVPTVEVETRDGKPSKSMYRIPV